MTTSGNQSALSIQQPYADAILDGRLDHTRRSKRTNKRERVFLYATRDIVDDERFPVDPAKECVTSAVLGAVDIIDCVKVEDGYHWMLANPERFDAPRRVVNGPQPMFWTPQFESGQTPS